MDCDQDLMGRPVAIVFRGAGDRKAPKADGAGTLYIDGIRVMKPVQ